jgi:hypothetical protein
LTRHAGEDSYFDLNLQKEKKRRLLFSIGLRKVISKSCCCSFFSFFKGKVVHKNKKRRNDTHKKKNRKEKEITICSLSLPLLNPYNIKTTIRNQTIVSSSSSSF